MVPVPHQGEEGEGWSYQLLLRPNQADSVPGAGSEPASPGSSHKSQVPGVGALVRKGSHRDRSNWEGF